ncbi:MAG TPA: metallophosphoesterase [Dongiaceae bacterium]|nr:metallophosphoesterase [Dongiaceae bacterium]
MRTTIRTLAVVLAVIGAVATAARAAVPPVTARPAAPAPAAAPAAAAPARKVAGSVYDDANRNGRRDPGEAGIAGVAVSDLRDVVVTGADGRYALEAAGDAAVISVSLPDGWAAPGKSWRLLERPPAGPPASIDFPLVRRAGSGTFTFLHASDTHLSPQSLPRTVALRALVEKEKPDFVIITGDLVRDALRVGETEARGYYELLAGELAKFTVPVFVVPGNHDLFGIERALSLVSRDHPMYGRALCRSFVGPEYFSFTWGGIHFVGLHSVDFEDTAYYGHVDAAQVEWLRRDLAHLPAAMPVVTFNHIPFVSAVERLSGFTEDPPAPTLIRIDGRPQYRHVVSNLAEVLDSLGGHRLEIALGGHLHTSERIVLDTSAGRVRFHQTGAVVGPSDAPGFQFVSGVTLYHAKDGHIDDGTFIPLDAPATHPAS